jgi:opacity protein-like surface antigen
MKRLLLLIWLIGNCKLAFTQEVLLSGGFTMPLSPYSSQDILDNTNGHALNGYNIKLDYIILKQNSLNFSLGLVYFKNTFDVKNIQKQNNTVYSQNSIYTSLKPYNGLGFGASILYYFTPIKSKLRGFSKLTLGQLFVNSPEYSKTDSLEYVKVLSNDANSIYWSLGAGIEYAITSEICLIGYADYFYSKVDFGNIKIANAAGQTRTLPATKINEQTLGMLNFNIGISYKFYKQTYKLKRKKM